MNHVRKFLKEHPKVRKILKEYIKPITPFGISGVGGILLSKNIKKFMENIKIKGDVLDIGGQRKQYKKYFHSGRYFSLDLDKRWNPEICCDAHDIKCEENKFELVIASEILEHCYNPQKVVDEIYRVLKSEGICLVSIPFICCYHIAPGVKDYCRLSEDGLRYLFRKFSNVEVKSFGNRFQIIWSMINTGLVFNFFLNIFNFPISRINIKGDSDYPFGYILIARKQKK